MATRRGRDFRIEYDSDNGQTYRIAQRTYEDVATGDRLTPITPLLLARIATGAPPVDAGRISARYALACIPNPGLSGGVSRMKAISPYRPTDPRLKQHLIEILDYSTDNFEVQTIQYFGEAVS